MSSLEKPSSVTTRRIYFALVQKPRSFQDLVKVIKVDKTTLEIALIFLKEQGMVISYNFNNCKKIRMVRTQPLRYGWNLPWLDLMMSEDDWKTSWKHILNNVENKLSQRLVKLLKDLLVDPNLDLIEVLNELEMNEVPLEILKLHNQQPFCLECLKKEKRFVRMVLCEQSEEHCCPNCGVVRETLLVKRR